MMNCWEYRTEKLESAPKGTDWNAHMASQLNALGKEGWELVSVATMDRGTFCDLHAFLNRPKAWGT